MKIGFSIIAFLCIMFNLLIANVSSAQTEQVFYKDNFRVKCICKLVTNDLFIKMASQTMDYPISAYICTENKDFHEKLVIVNINIYDLSSSYSRINESAYSQFENTYLKSYIKDLIKVGILYTEKSFHGVKAVEYTFQQMGLPSKAIVFIKNKKSYLLQVGAQQGLNVKYNNLINSFNFLR